MLALRQACINKGQGAPADKILAALANMHRNARVPETGFYRARTPSAILTILRIRAVNPRKARQAMNATGGRDPGAGLTRTAFPASKPNPPRGEPKLRRGRGGGLARGR